ncbi:MAG TPA: class I SAM-dependent methyltransferase [Chloroflexota bacterium]|jgi:SAM-dependent methyltransferase|nr:class I SAM-dependent methyltransferase [Chloroflexota bacterium]
MARWQRAVGLLPTAGRVLDLGCAFGYGTRMLARTHQAYGLDASPRFIARARRAAPEIPFALAPAEALPYEDGFFDGVLLLDVLEHVRREERVLAEVYRVLRPGGMLVLSVPHRGALAWLDSLNIWDFYAGGGSHPSDEVIPGGYPYHRHYAERDLRRLLGPRFTVRRVERTGLGLVEPLNLALLALCKGLLRSQWLYDRLVYLYYGAYIAEDLLRCGSASYHLMIQAVRLPA